METNTRTAPFLNNQGLSFNFNKEESPLAWPLPIASLWWPLFLGLCPAVQEWSSTHPLKSLLLLFILHEFAAAVAAEETQSYLKKGCKQGIKHEDEKRLKAKWQKCKWGSPQGLGRPGRHHWPLGNMEAWTKGIYFLATCEEKEVQLLSPRPLVTLQVPR